MRLRTGVGLVVLGLLATSCGSNSEPTKVSLPPSVELRQVHFLPPRQVRLTVSPDQQPLNLAIRSGVPRLPAYGFDYAVTPAPDDRFLTLLVDPGSVCSYPTEVIILRQDTEIDLEVDGGPSTVPTDIACGGPGRFAFVHVSLEAPVGNRPVRQLV